MLSFFKAKEAAPAPPDLFPRTDPAVDGDECLRDCESCTAKYPRGFQIDEEDVLYGNVKGWDTHLVVATGKGDWVRDVEDEEGSVMQAIGRAGFEGNMKLSASDMPTPDGTPDYDQPTSALLLPAFTYITELSPVNVPLLLNTLLPLAPTTTSPLFSSSGSVSGIPPIVTDSAGKMPPLRTAPCPHAAVVFLCSQRTRDARCGQSAPLLRRELERHLRTWGLYRDAHDERPGGVVVRFISHVGGHKYSANVIVYRRPDAFGLDDGDDTEAQEQEKKETKKNAAGDPGAGQCIWLARVRPEDCENLVRYTVRRGKVVKPERQLRGGFDRARGKTSW